MSRRADIRKGLRETIRSHPAVESLDGDAGEYFVNLAPGWEWSGQRSFGAETLTEAERLLQSVERSKVEEVCGRCGGSRKLRSGAYCPDCTHIVTERYTPVSVIARCSCERFTHVETRRQNALGRAAKMKAAIGRHLREVSG